MGARDPAIMRDASELAERDVPDFYEVDHSKITAKMTRLPLPSEAPYPVMMEPNYVIEFCSRQFALAEKYTFLFIV